MITGAPSPTLWRAGLPGGSSADLLDPPRRIWTWLIGGLAAALGIAVVWAATGAIDEIATGDGRIIPAGKIKVVQSLDGGIVGGIRVHEGQSVAEGDVLLNIDPTGVDASVGEQREKLAGLQITEARLKAEMAGETPVFPDALHQTHAAQIANERALFEARRSELQAALQGFDNAARQRGQEIEETRARIVSLEAALEITEREGQILRPMVERGVAGKLELVRFEQRQNDQRGQIAAARLAIPRLEAAVAEAGAKRQERIETARNEAATRLASVAMETAALTEAMRAGADKLRRTEIRAPVAGLVKTVHATTIGEIVKPGVNIVEIVPAEEALVVEARIRPQDIAFLHPGQEATVKITAYDYAIYGGLKGRLEQIGADSVTTEKGETYYVVRIRTDGDHLEKSGSRLPILPGMIANVEIKTGRKTVLDYLLKPVTRLRHESLRER